MLAYSSPPDAFTRSPPCRRPARRLLPIVGAVLLLLAVAGQVAALSTYYPIQSLGNRGSDVRALQYLLRGARPSQ